MQILLVPHSENLSVQMSAGKHGVVSFPLSSERQKFVRTVTRRTSHLLHKVGQCFCRTPLLELRVKVIRTAFCIVLVVIWSAQAESPDAVCMFVFALIHRLNTHLIQWNQRS